MVNGNTQSWTYFGLMRGVIRAEEYIPAALLIEEVKQQNITETEEELYSSMLMFANKKGIKNPFPDVNTFYRLYKESPEKLNWEIELERELKSNRYTVLADALIQKFEEHLSVNPDTVLIAEAENFVPQLQKIVDEYINTRFTLTTHNINFANIFQHIFAEYENVEVVVTNIYEYGFIVFLPTNSFYQVLSAEAYSKHGFNIHGVVFDELHTQPNRKLFDVMTKGSGDARMQPLYFLITTAGTDTKSICYETHQKAKDILEGRKIDPTFYPVIYGADEGDDWTDPKIWKKANPSLGITVGIDKVKAACESARQNPAEENTFRQLRLNQWVKQQVRWMPMEKWDGAENLCTGTGMNTITVESDMLHLHRDMQVLTRRYWQREMKYMRMQNQGILKDGAPEKRANGRPQMR